MRKSLSNTSLAKLRGSGTFSPLDLVRCHIWPLLWLYFPRQSWYKIWESSSRSRCQPWLGGGRLWTDLPCILGPLSWAGMSSSWSLMPKSLPRLLQYTPHGAALEDHLDITSGQHTMVHAFLCAPVWPVTPQLWWSVSFWVQFSILIIAFKTLNDTGPSYLQNTLDEGFCWFY